jgi:VWFA-related protein
MRTALVFLLLLIFARTALAEQDAGGAGSEKQAGAPASAASTKPDRTVTLEVVVTDKAGKPVSGLQEQDFTLLDDKLTQKLRTFHAMAAATSPTPVEIILLVDSVNATFQTVAAARQEIAKFLGQGGGKLALPVAMGFFSNAGIKLQSSPTRDGQAVLAFFDENSNGLRTITQSGGFYGGIERQQLSLRALALLAETVEKMPGRKLLVWISPGWPLFSGPGLDLTLKQRQGIFQSVVGLSGLLRQADITMYEVDPLRAQRERDRITIGIF